MGEMKYDGDREIVQFTAPVNGNPVIIDVSREGIEDTMEAENMTPDECLAFVERNRNQIVENVAGYLHQAPDVTGIRVGNEQLKHCR